MTKLNSLRDCEQTWGSNVHKDTHTSVPSSWSVNIAWGMHGEVVVQSPTGSLLPAGYSMEKNHLAMGNITFMWIYDQYRSDSVSPCLFGEHFGLQNPPGKAYSLPSLLRFIFLRGKNGHAISCTYQEMFMPRMKCLYLNFGDLDVSLIHTVDNHTS